MKGELSGMEREMIISSFCKDKSLLIIQPTFEKKRNKPSLAINKELYKVLEERIIFFPFSQTVNILENWKEINVCFFYKGMGVFFQSVCKKITNGFACVIPSILYKQPDNSNVIDNNSLTACVYYSLKKDEKNSIQCCTDKAFPVFTPDLWNYFPKNEINQTKDLFYKLASISFVELPELLKELINFEHRILYIPDKKIPDKNYFPFNAGIVAQDIDPRKEASIDTEIKQLNEYVYIPFSSKPDEAVYSIAKIHTDSISVSPMDVEDSIYMLSVCRYLSIKKHTIKPVETRVEPMHIIYLNESVIIFGCLNNKLEMEKGTEYLVSIYIPLVGLKREINTKVFVSQIYREHQNVSCVVCRFSQIKEEDRRFLYEKHYKTKYM